MTKLMLTNSNYLTVNRNQQNKPEMSKSVKVTLTSCFELNLVSPERDLFYLPTSFDHLIGKMLLLINCNMERKSAFVQNIKPCLNKQDM